MSCECVAGGMHLKFDKHQVRKAVCPRQIYCGIISSMLGVADPYLKCTRISIEVRFVHHVSIIHTYSPTECELLETRTSYILTSIDMAPGGVWQTAPNELFVTNEWG